MLGRWLEVAGGGCGMEKVNVVYSMVNISVWGLCVLTRAAGNDGLKWVSPPR